MIRVLIVEDSPTAQLLLRGVLESDPAIQVIGVSSNGCDALDDTLALRPDLITMDLHLPGMDGYEATRHIMDQCPTPIVVVSAMLDSTVAEASFDAIQAGALDVVEKPVGVLARDYEQIRDRLITTVKLMAEVKVIHRRYSPQRAAEGEPAAGLSARMRPARRPASRSYALLAIGSSTGGPAALRTLLRVLPAAFPVPVIVVQHMSAGFTGGLIAWLQSDSRLQLRMAAESEPVRPGVVYFAPDDTHLELASRSVLTLNTGPMINHVRPSVDVLFSSVAHYYGAEAIAVLLTGMGEDGARGMRAIRDRAGLTIAQDEATSVVYGMPGAAVRLGAVDHILPLGQIAPLLLEIVPGTDLTGVPKPVRS